MDSTSISLLHRLKELVSPLRGSTRGPDSDEEKRTLESLVDRLVEMRSSSETIQVDETMVFDSQEAAKRKQSAVPVKRSSTNSLSGLSEDFGRCRLKRMLGKGGMDNQLPRVYLTGRPCPAGKTASLPNQLQ